MSHDIDVTQLLMDVLSRKVSKKVDLQIRERVAANVCVCCGKNPIWRDGNCRACDYEIEVALASIPKKQGKISYMTSLYEDGLRLRPYEIRKYRKPVSELTRRAKEAS